MAKRLIPYIGCYYPDPSLEIASSVGNSIILSFPELMNESQGYSDMAEKVRSKGLYVFTSIPSLHGVDSLFYSFHTLLDELRIMAAQTKAVGIYDHIHGILLSEEWFSSLRGGVYLKSRWGQHLMETNPKMEGQELYHLAADLLADRLSLLAQWSRYWFPMAHVGHVEPSPWGSQRLGLAYQPIPAHYTFVGHDIYERAPLSASSFFSSVEMTYASTAAATKLPILCCTQTFKDAIGGWREMPPVSRLTHWAEMVARYPQIQGVFHFCCTHPSGNHNPAGPLHPRGWGFDSSPAHVSALSSWFSAQQSLPRVSASRLFEPSLGE